MQVFISADIEGITGLVAWSQCGGVGDDCPDFDFARNMMLHDVNAAIRGARAAGAKRVVVRDAHGNSKNLLVDQLEEGVELISGVGVGENGMMAGIEPGFDAALLVGYHGMVGTRAGIMEHTFNGANHRIFINGTQVGEMAFSAATAGAMGIPLVMVSSDLAGCREAESFLAGVKTAVTKEGIGRYMGKLFHPSVTGPAIEKAAKEGVRACKSIAPYKVAEPVTIRIEANRTDGADAVEAMPGMKRLDAFTLEGTFGTWFEAHKAAWLAVDLVGEGPEANH